LGVGWFGERIGVIRDGFISALAVNQVPAWNLGFILATSTPLASFTGESAFGLSLHEQSGVRGLSQATSGPNNTNLNAPFDGNFQSYSVPNRKHEQSFQPELLPGGLDRCSTKYPGSGTAEREVPLLQVFSAT